MFVLIYPDVQPDFILIPFFQDRISFPPGFDTGLLQSISLIALKSKIKPEFRNTDPILDAYLQHRVSPVIPEETLILTDNYAPVEYFVNFD